MNGRADVERLRAQLRLYFVMGSANCAGDPLETAAQGIAGGVTMFQFREKGAGSLEGEAKLRLAGRLRALCRAKGVPFLVNDDVELALSVEADGVHVGQDDESVAAVRRRIGGKLLGVSVHTVEEARRAAEEGADYFGIGPIYPTATKADAKPAAGTALIERLRAEGWTTPIVGIGGIDASNAGGVIRAGADGVAVVTALSRADSIERSARELLRSVASARPAGGSGGYDT